MSAPSIEDSFDYVNLNGWKLPLSANQLLSWFCVILLIDGIFGIFVASRKMLTAKNATTETCANVIGIESQLGIAKLSWTNSLTGNQNDVLNREKSGDRPRFLNVRFEYDSAFMESKAQLSDFV